jgi:hypothetical protein
MFNDSIFLSGILIVTQPLTSQNVETPINHN